MKVTALFGMLVAATVAVANPLENESALEKRQYGWGYAGPQVTLYRDVDYRGRAEYITVQPGRCTNVARRLNDRVSSMRVSSGLQCTIFVNANCRGGAYPVNSPGVRNFVRRGINDAMSSLVCY